MAFRCRFRRHCPDRRLLRKGICALETSASKSVGYFEFDPFRDRSRRLRFVAESLGGGRKSPGHSRRFASLFPTEKPEWARHDLAFLEFDDWLFPYQEVRRATPTPGSPYSASTALEAEGVRLAKHRHHQLEDLMESDPRQALETKIKGTSSGKFVRGPPSFSPARRAPARLF